MYRRAAIVAIVIGHFLAAYYAWRAFSGSWTWAALILGLIVGHLLVDSLTLVLHWLLDNYMSAKTPVIGPVIFFFREHHVDERAMFSRDYFESNFENALVGALVLAAMLPFALPSSAQFMLCFVGFGSAYVTQIHKWAHNPSRPWPIGLLQRSRLIISEHFHDRHHKDGRRNYGLYAGWLDGSADKIRFFEALEVLLFVATGAVAVETRVGLADPNEVLMFRARCRRTFWRLWYAFLAGYARRRSAEFSCMNWGYADIPDGPRTCAAVDAEERYSLQLYDALCASTHLESRTIVDVSCGRGGGVSYLHERYRPLRAVGVDIVEANIGECRRSFSADDLMFHRGSAEAIPLTDGEADVVISVEASHCYGELKRFLSEVHRVLSPGGELLWTDFVAASEMNNRRALVREMFELLEERDITQNVLLAMRLDAARRQSFIRKFSSPLLQRVLLNFAAAGEDQPSYKTFANGRDCYFLFRLRRK